MTAAKDPRLHLRIQNILSQAHMHSKLLPEAAPMFETVSSMVTGWSEMIPIVTARAPLTSRQCPHLQEKAAKASQVLECRYLP